MKRFAVSVHRRLLPSLHDGNCSAATQLPSVLTGHAPSCTRTSCCRAAASAPCVRSLHASSSHTVDETGPNLGGMPTSKLKRGEEPNPRAHDDGPEQPATTFRQGVAEAFRQGVQSRQDGSGEADHPAHKYQEAGYVSKQPGRADDVGTAGMPTERPVRTPAEGLGNEPGAGEPEPQGRGGLDSVPDALGRNPHPHNQDSTRMQRTPADAEPMISKTGTYDWDASMEPGTLPEDARRGSTEYYDPEFGEEQRKSPENPRPRTTS